MSEETRIPPKFLVNLHHDDIDRVEVAKAVADYIRLGKDEAALLNYYAAHDTGWQASQTVVERETGISARNLTRTRKALEEKGILSVDTDAVVIDWRRLAGVAFLAEVAPESNARTTYRDESGTVRRTHPKKNLEPYQVFPKEEPDDIPGYIWYALTHDDPATQPTEEELVAWKERGRAPYISGPEPEIDHDEDWWKGEIPF